MKIDTLQTNCQSSITRLSTIGMTLKSICVSLIIGLIAAFYGSSFFKVMEKSTNNAVSLSYIWSITVVFTIVALIVIILFAYLSSYYLSLERGYVNLYNLAPYRQPIKPKSKNIGSDFFPIVYLKKLPPKQNIPLYEEFLHATRSELTFSICNFNNLPEIKRTKVIKCFFSKSIFPFYLMVLLLSLSMICFSLVLTFVH